MKKLMSWLAPAFCVLLIVAVTGLSTNTIEKAPEKVKVENISIAEAVPDLKLEIKESYKLDNSEYKSSVATPTSFSGYSLGTLSFSDVLWKIMAVVGILTLIVKQSRKRLIVGGALLVLFAVANYFQVPSDYSFAAFPAIAFMRDKDGGEGNGLTDEQLKKIADEMSKKNADAIVVALDKALKDKDFLSSEDLTSTLKEMGADKEAIKKINDALKEQGLKMKSLELGAGKDKHFKETIKGSINDPDKVKALQKAASDGSGIVTLFKSHDDDISNKVVGTMTSDMPTTDTGGLAILDLLNADELAGINLRQPFVEQFATVSRTAKPVFTYADYEPKDGGAGFTAEAAAKSQMDLKLSVKHATPKKATGYEVMSTEAIQDIPRLQSEATGLLLAKYLLKRQEGILFGDGTGDTPIGVTSLARAWSAASWTGEKVSDPNLYDVMVAMANQITTTYNYTDEPGYYPNVAFVNPGVFNALRLKKNEFGMYLFPQMQIGGKLIQDFAVVPQRDIPAAKVLMGDFTKLRVINYVDYAVKMGWINDQFIKNLFTMLGEGRFFTVIKNLERNAFIYDDIATVSADIAAA